MFEKLPPKPSLKGNEWAVDASNCQACNSAFTFFHRKHHCRRCGGIFCGDCTQQRINLRGQGEGPVRICDACKKLEDAARLELRSGYRHKVSKGALNMASSGDSVPSSKEIDESDRISTSTKSTTLMNEVNDLIAPKYVGSMSSGEEIKAGSDEIMSTQITPEMLLLQAQEEKKQWLALKKEGKNNEALLAFKRSKELERQAESLKLSLRKSQRNSVTSLARQKKHEETDTVNLTESTHSIASKDAVIGTEKGTHLPRAKKTSTREIKEKTDDMMTALKELGWSDADLQDAGGRQNKEKTVESELAELAAAAHHGNESNFPNQISSMEVLAHKRKALALKKEGNIAEAKEELKKAKLLERQLEEQQMLGDEEEESDDDFCALMKEIDKGGVARSMDMDMNMDFLSFNNIQEDDDQGLDISDADMDDPEMLAALRSLGWEEDAAEMEKASRGASAKPRISGNLLKHGENAVGGFGCLEGYEGSLDGVKTVKVPSFSSTLMGKRAEEEEPVEPFHSLLSWSKDKLDQEISSLKKEALALKRTGKLEEAKDELRRAKQLEKQFYEMKSRYDDDEILDAFSVPQYQPYRSANTEAAISDEDHEESMDVTEDDMEDPELAKTLKLLGWEDEHGTDEDLATEIEPSEKDLRASHRTKNKAELQKDLLGIKRAALKLRRQGKVEEAEEELEKAQIIEQLIEDLGRGASTTKNEIPIEQDPANSNVHVEKNMDADLKEPVKSVQQENASFDEVTSRPRSEIQQLVTPSSKKNAPAEEVFSSSKKESFSRVDGQHFQEPKVFPEQGLSVPVPSLEAQMEPRKEHDILTPMESRSTVVQSPMHASQQQILVLKRQALALKREGKQLEAKEKLKEAKMAEKMLASASSSSMSDQIQVPSEHHEAVAPAATSRGQPTTSVMALSKSPFNTTKIPPPKSAGKDRMKLQQESLAHKRKALALRREGKTEEADKEFELAKSIENTMEELGNTAEMPSAVPRGDDFGLVEDLVDPQLFAALKELGWKESDIHGTAPEVRPETSNKLQKATDSKIAEAAINTSTRGFQQSKEKQELEQKIKSEKVRALKLKRAGKQEEALEVLRGAKILERKLQ